MKHLLLIVVPVLIYVFACGVQAINLAERKLAGTFLTSLVIGTANLLILKVVPKIENFTDGTAYVLTAAIAITASAWIYPKRNLTGSKNGV